MKTREKAPAATNCKGLEIDKNAGSDLTRFPVYNATKSAEMQNCALCTPTTSTNSNTTFFCAAHVAAENNLAAVLLTEIARPRKVVRLQKCAGCGKCKSAAKFSIYYAVCRECFHDARTKGKTAQSNFIQRTLANFQRSLQGGLQNV